jgi:hypothetical protein
MIVPIASSRAGCRCDPNGGAGRKTVPERLADAVRKILGTFHAISASHVDTIDSVQRDCTIRDRYSRGETLSALAREFGLSPQRVFQIVNLSD